MKALINGTDNPLFFFFKLFSVFFTTAMLVEFSFAYYHNTNIYIAIALSVPFAWFYAFNYIGSLEIAEKLKMILISGLVMMSFYLTLAEPIKKALDKQALFALQSDIDYLDLKKEFESNNYNAEAYADADKKYNLYKNKKVKTLNEAEWKAKKTAELIENMYDEHGKKSSTYKAEVSTALLHRDATPHLKKIKRLTPLNSVEKVVYVLWDKVKSNFNKTHSSDERASKLEELKKAKMLLSRDYLREKRATARAKYEEMEKNAIETNSFTKREVQVLVLAVGFLVEILLNAASFWRNLAVNGGAEEARVNTMLTLLNKELLMDKLAPLNIIHEKGRSKGKVFALYATMINIIILYKERDKKVFARTEDITDEQIVNFKFLDVNAKRHIPKVFEILNGLDVKSLSMNDILSIIEKQKAKQS